jgi:hypothetical protein
MPPVAVAAAVLAAFTLAVTPSAHAAEPVLGPDRVVLTTGQSYRGWVKGQDERRLYLLGSSGKVTELPLSVVASVEKGYVPPTPEPAAATATATAAAATAASGAQAGGTGVAPNASGEAVPAAADAPAWLFGLGVGLTSAGAGVLYLPLQLHDEFRLELELGRLSASVNGTTETTSHFGLGIVGMDRITPWARAYYGGRIFVDRDSASATKGTGVALVAGGEWTPTRHVALGVEAQLRLARVTTSVPSAADVSATGTSLLGIAFVRVFLSR